MATVVNFEDLEIWKLAHKQTIDYFSICNQSALAKDFPLKNQMNASSGSVMDNIAEGFERSSTNEFRNFLIIAKGSNGEFRSQLIRCLDRGYINQEEFNTYVSRNLTLSKKIMSFINYLSGTSVQGLSRRNSNK